MKELMLTALTVCLLQASVALADGCNNQTLNGTVAEAWHKTQAQLPGSDIYMESWDGAGHIQYLSDDHISGQQSSGLFYGTGTYTITSDCIATVVYDGGTHAWKYYVDKDGHGYTWIDGFNRGIVQAGHTELMTRALLVDPTSAAPGPCTLETLRGTMVLSDVGTSNGVPVAIAKVEVYDGAGNATYVQTASDGFTTNTHNGTATYTITDRCVASVYQDGSASPSVIFVAPDGSAYWAMSGQNGNSVGAVLAAKALRVSRGHQGD